jgi:hypothetical protein
MPAILQFGVTMQCPHGGTVIAVPTNMSVRVGGAFALLQSDVFTIVGCPFMVGPKPQPHPAAPNPQRDRLSGGRYRAGGGQSARFASLS